MRYWIIGLLALVSCEHLVLAQDVEPEAPPVSLDPQTFDFNEEIEKFVWRRPPEVTHLIISGCGGGGGGGVVRLVGSSGMSGVVVGAGGGASRVDTLLIPVSADTYTILIGRGGRPGGAGASTTFSGSDGTFSFQGGRAGELPPTGRSQIDGEASPFGEGGKGYAAIRSNGSNAATRCAGGGAGGIQQRGGQGGPGFLVIYPMPDVARSARVLEKLEQNLQQ